MGVTNGSSLNINHGAPGFEPGSNAPKASSIDQTNPRALVVRIEFPLITLADEKGDWDIIPKEPRLFAKL